MQQGLELEFLDDNNLAGFRLQKLEILNWGTFNQKIWQLEINGKNGLLTGDIGSGKSTVVDAITTLLVPANRIAYNKAAGAESKERNLRSYVLGYYKSERDNETGIVKPAQLRNNSSYSVILGIFYNEGYDQYITLAQVFWLKEQQTQPARFFVGAEKPLSINEHFANFGSEMNALRKKLRQMDIDTFDTFPPYSAWFRRRFGIQNDQALELFHQTVSMKSVGNLTEFVRSHMLEPFEETQQRIEHLLLHFDDLNRAYQAVLKAEDQVSLLTPIVQSCQQYQQIEQQIANISCQIDQLSPYFNMRKCQLLEKQLTQLEQEYQNTSENIQQLELVKAEQVKKLDQIKWDIQQNGGNRLTELKQQIQEKERIKTERLSKFEQYKKQITELDEIIATNQTDFITQKSKLAQKHQLIEQQITEQRNLEVEATTDLRHLEKECNGLNDEIQSLKQRENNISRRQIEIRQQLCQELNLDVENLPFIGELLQVKETEKDWEGAAERLLHNFALSMIVSEEHYVKVADWVNNNHLNGRIVYYKVNKHQTMLSSELHPDSLIYKLEIKPNIPFYQWLENELYKRFDFAACDSAEQFRRESKAITLKGQIKDKTGRHEKDDRYRIDDRSRYVLGWSNAEKITALTQTLKQCERQLSQVQQKIIGYKQTQSTLDKQNKLLVRLESFQTFAEIDFETTVREIALLNDEYQQLQSSSNILSQLNDQLKALEIEIKACETQYIELVAHKGGLDSEIKSTKTELETTALLAEESPVETDLAEKLGQELNGLLESLNRRSLTLINCGDIENKLRTKFNGENKKLSDKQDREREKIINKMSDFNHKYPLETNEFDASIKSYLEYEAFLNRLNADDLPKFVAQFKKLLNENTINEIANLNAQLNRERETIKQRIGIINRSLESIDYNPGRYISLETGVNPDLEIRQFQLDLRACTEGAVTGSESNQYSEAKFLQVKAIVDRFRGREGLTEQDKRWAAKVTDVRNWFLFSATERWRADHSEHENYPDSGGKSGGQKEKLAYTILAASLAYQFGLEFGVTRSRSFRFVMIDEAFGRGSDESAQYGLRLFKQLNLQLLIVTPLQKVDIIEPFVSSVCLVKNQDGANSRLLNLTIEEYQIQKTAGQLNA